MARAFVSDVLAGSVSAETVEAAETVVSELVTNAVVHAGTPAEVEVRVEGPDDVYLAVTDGAPQHPLRPRSGVERSTGRGLMLVESLTREWGVALHSDRKALWCRIGAAREDHTPPPDTPAEAGAARTSGITVNLVNAPVTLFWSWTEGAEALLRDYLLAGIEEAGPERSLSRHVACSQALAVVVEGFAAVTGDSSATTPERANGLVKLTVPPGSVEDFVTLDEVLSDAVEVAATSGEYLSAVTSATAQNFRRWLCREVRAQAAGAVATPWAEDVVY